MSERDQIGRAPPRAEIASREPEPASSPTSAEATSGPRELAVREDEPLPSQRGVEPPRDSVADGSRDASGAGAEASCALDVSSHVLDQDPDTLVERTDLRLLTSEPGFDTPTARHLALTLEGARRRSSSEATRRPTAPLRGLHDVELLVVDDDDDARWLLARYLERAGARVRTAGSVREAEEALARRRPHALVSDIGMPFEDGRTLVARLRRHEAETGLPRLPAIAVTAFVGIRERDASLAAGFDAQLAKPLDPARLVELLRSLLV